MKQFDDRFDFEDPIDIKACYFREVAEYSHLVNLPPDRERELVEQARNGSTEAREMIILSGLAYVIRVAYGYFKTLATSHDELLDLISIGNGALVEMVDVALGKQYPIPYLCMYAKIAIRRHCYYRSDLIVRPLNFERKTVTSLDILVDESFDLPLPEERPVEEHVNSVFNEALYEAIASLTELQREVLIRHYGLFGQPEERLVDIHRGDGVAYRRRQKALIALRKKLAGLM
jgi:DNA-directed RNA polymerase sigma subunit (sigma70/sigma32)